MSTMIPAVDLIGVLIVAWTRFLREAMVVVVWEMIETMIGCLAARESARVAFAVSILGFGGLFSLRFYVSGVGVQIGDVGEPRARPVLNGEDSYRA